MLSAIGLSGELKTIENKTWKTYDIFGKCGIETIDGKLFGGKLSDHDLYGFRKGTEEEAKKLKYAVVGTIERKINSPGSPSVSSAGPHSSGMGISQQSLPNSEELNTFQALQKLVLQQAKDFEEMKRAHAQELEEVKKFVKFSKKKNDDVENEVDGGSQSLAFASKSEDPRHGGGVHKMVVLRESVFIRLQNQVDLLTQHVVHTSPESLRKEESASEEDREKLLGKPQNQKTPSSSNSSSLA